LHKKEEELNLEAYFYAREIIMKNKMILFDVVRKVVY
jgi:hypothetical protein